MQSRTEILVTVQEIVECDLAESHKRMGIEKCHYNVSRAPRTAITRLKNNDNLVRQADKGGAVLILERDL